MNGMSGSGGYGSDELEGTPPIPIPRAASMASSSSPSPMRAPRPSAAAMSLTGAGPAGDLISDMMQLEQLVGRIIKRVPGLASVAQPFIDQMRDLGAASLADQAGGGIGSTNPEAAAPPPGGGMSPMGAGAGGGMGGGMMPPMPLVI